VAERFGASELERFCCEWTFTREQYEPLAAMEAERVATVLGMVADGNLAPRHLPEMPKGAQVVDVAKGAWVLERDGVTVDTGSTWQCGYCSRRTLCATTEPGLIPLSSLTERGEAA